MTHRNYKSPRGDEIRGISHCDEPDLDEDKRYKELLAEKGLSVDDDGFEELMEEQRTRARMGTATAHGSEDHHGAVLSFASAAPPTSFVGYEKLRAETSLLAVEGDDGRALVKLEESPFYAEGGGQVADSGVLRWKNGDEAGVVDVYRVGEDQVLEVDARRPRTREGGRASLPGRLLAVVPVPPMARHLIGLSPLRLVGRAAGRRDRILVGRHQHGHTPRGCPSCHSWPERIRRQMRQAKAEPRQRMLSTSPWICSPCVSSCRSTIGRDFSGATSNFWLIETIAACL